MAVDFESNLWCPQSFQEMNGTHYPENLLDLLASVSFENRNTRPPTLPAIRTEYLDSVQNSFEDDLRSGGLLCFATQ